jgi:hydroxypyruvate reductase
VSEASGNLVRDARSIWQAGVRAVDSARLVAQAIRVRDGSLCIGPHSIALSQVRRIVVVGAGKAGAGMAEGLLDALGQAICREKGLSGWVNVPDDCVRTLPAIRLFGARPPGENKPTSRVFEGTRQILSLVEQCEPNDLCIALISGGGSALLDLPLPPIALQEQVALIELLSAAQANIRQLNTVRKQISQVKGGRLGAACRAPLFSLIISDVLGDPLDVIASGPTVCDESSAEQALQILEQFDPDGSAIAASIYQVLRADAAPRVQPGDLAHVCNLVVGNLGVAVEAAATQARAMGYQTRTVVPTALEGLADDVGLALAGRLDELQDRGSPQAWIEGGEPVVRLVAPSERGLGGRNQQVVLACARAVWQGFRSDQKPFCVLSGGTDGEDGPTDAAGAWIDNDSLARARSLGLIPDHYLARNDAYHFFEPLGTLLRTGPTHTNVCDLRVIVSR